MSTSATQHFVAAVGKMDKAEEKAVEAETNTSSGLMLCCGVELEMSWGRLTIGAEILRPLPTCILSTLDRLGTYPPCPLHLSTLLDGYSTTALRTDEVCKYGLRLFLLRDRPVSLS